MRPDPLEPLLAKIAAEFAPGIPSKDVVHALPEIQKRTTWEYGLHEHDAVSRGPHHDLRLGDPETGHAHSWALGMTLPRPGEATWAIQQPTHTVEYMNFKGKIPSGYGAGTVKLKEREKIEIVNSRPGHITFQIFRGSGPEEFTLHQIKGEAWKFYNRTLTRDRLPGVPLSKPDYHSVPIEAIDYEDPRYLMSAKIDDAHNLFVFQRGDRVRAVSYRPTKRETGVIEHTPKVPGLERLDVPSELADTVLRGGLYAIHPKTGKAIEATQLAGMLNSDVWKSREKQKELGHLRPVIYDVVAHKGKLMTNAPYEEKLKVLHDVKNLLPVFELPPMAKTPKEKKELLEKIKKGDLPQTREGIVLWPLKTGTLPIKAKFFVDHDVYVREVFPGEGKYSGHAAGGFTFSHSPKGPVVGRVGSGFSDELREDLWKNRTRYLGAVARLSAQDKYSSGALRMPVFLGWHLDKNDAHVIDNLVQS
jgi:hypothetical protein